MQKTAAYLLERKEGLVTPEDFANEAARIRRRVDMWLESKGGAGVGDEGTYEAEDGSHATWARDHAQDGPRSWSLLRLDEVTQAGRRVSAIISTTTTGTEVAVYVTLEVGSATSGVKVVEADPRAPRIVRDLLHELGPWHHGTTRLYGLRSVRGFADGLAVAQEVVDQDRAVPIIVVSEHQGEQALPRLDDRLAYDLAGLANVVRVDSDASWALTDSLGVKLSCFSGAVRVYWPGVTQDCDPYLHPLWTASRLLAVSENTFKVKEAFRAQLRRLLMAASALSVVRPAAIDDIRDAASNSAHAALAGQATSADDFRGLAELYAKDNDKLRSELRAAQVESAELLRRVSILEGERAALIRRAEKVELRNRELEAEIEAEGEAGDEPVSGPPRQHEIRFYKKRYAAPTHDILVHTGDCGHNHWERAHAADKARKGIMRLEGDRKWKSMRHCAECEGGGMWRVEW